MPGRHTDAEKHTETRRSFLKASGAGAVAVSLAGPSAARELGGEQQSQETTTEEGQSDGGQSDGDVPTGGTLVYGMSAKPDTSNILTLGSVYAAVAVDRVYETGTTLDPVTSEVRPNVFTDWTVENTSGQNAQPDVYFDMREGLTWNDGEEFTAEDVLFTYRYYMENQPGNYAAAASPMEEIEESSRDDWDFHLKLSQPVGVWASEQLQIPLLPQHKWEGKDYQQYDPMEANPDNGPVGLGPGRLTQFDPATSMQVVFDNEYYYDTLSTLEWKQNHDELRAGGPFIDRVNYKVFGSETAMTNAFLQGGIDTHYGSMKTAQIPKVKQNDGMSLVNGTDSGFSYYAFNLRRKPLDDVTFRQAVAFMYDDYFWVQRLMNGYVWKGDFVQSNGYPKPRPDFQFAGEDQMLTHPATNAFDFRSADQGPTPDVEGVRTFLTEGNVVDGSEGTYVGKDYPGSLSGVSASRSESKYDYSFGPVQSQVLREHDGADRELRVDGKTIPQTMDGDAITMFIDPPKQGPKEAKAIERWVNNLKSVGIPVKTQALSFNTMTSRVYYEEDFDIYPMGWGGTGPFGSSAYSFFHSDNADDHSKDGNSDSFMYNSTAYGLYGGSSDDLLSQARTTMDAEERNRTTARAVEKIYLDMPYILRDYAKFRWPLNTAKFGGQIPDIVDPAFANFGAQVNNLHLTE